MMMSERERKYVYAVTDFQSQLNEKLNPFGISVYIDHEKLYKAFFAEVEKMDFDLCFRDIKIGEQSLDVFRSHIYYRIGHFIGTLVDETLSELFEREIVQKLSGGPEDLIVWLDQRMEEGHKWAKEIAEKIQ